MPEFPVLSAPREAFAQLPPAQPMARRQWDKTIAAKRAAKPRYPVKRVAKPLEPSGFFQAGW